MNKLMMLALLSPLVACGAATPAPNHAVASHVAPPGASFESYQTFAFGPAEPPRAGYRVTPHSLEVQRRLGAVVKTALQDRGLTEATDHPDMVVKLATGNGFGYQLRPSQGFVGIPPERASGPVPNVGFIGINIYARASGSQIWQGSAFAEIDPTTIDDALLRVGVDHMLQGFGAPKTESMAKAP
jgi:hypothetical protein